MLDTACYPSRPEGRGFPHNWMNFDNWMLAKNPKYHSTDDSVALRLLRECWTDAQKYANSKVCSDKETTPVDFLLNGERFKLSFQHNECEACGAVSSRQLVVPLDQYAQELHGRWVALVPAENDMHLRMVTSQWQPMTTAPKDGTRILVQVPPDSPEELDDEILVVSWSCIGQSTVGSWTVPYSEDDQGGAYWVQPAGWRPLPPVSF